MPDRSTSRPPTRETRKTRRRHSPKSNVSPPPSFLSFLLFPSFYSCSFLLLLPLLLPFFFALFSSPLCCHHTLDNDGSVSLPHLQSMWKSSRMAGPPRGSRLLVCVCVCCSFFWLSVLLSRLLSHSVDGPAQWLSPFWSCWGWALPSLWSARTCPKRRSRAWS